MLYGLQGFGMGSFGVEERNASGAVVGRSMQSALNVVSQATLANARGYLHGVDMLGYALPATTGGRTGGRQVVSVATSAPVTQAIAARTATIIAPSAQTRSTDTGLPGGAPPRITGTSGSSGGKGTVTTGSGGGMANRINSRPSNIPGGGMARPIAQGGRGSTGPEAQSRPAEKSSGSVPDANQGSDQGSGSVPGSNQGSGSGSGSDQGSGADQGSENTFTGGEGGGGGGGGSEPGTDDQTTDQGTNQSQAQATPPKPIPWGMVAAGVGALGVVVLLMQKRK